jgi:2-keto-4-pentenoate hydratase
MKRSLVVAAMVLMGVACAAPARAACPADEEAKAVAEAYVGGKQLPPPAGLSAEDAMCGRDKVLRLIEPHYGRVAGYKAGLTNPAAQKIFNYSAPVRGVLFERMLKREGEAVSVSAPGTVFEADLIVEVKDAAINDAKTPLEALRSIRAIYPFIEVPRLLFNAPPAQLGGPNLIYANVAAFSGVLGKAVTVEASQAGLDALANMTVTLTDGTGATLDSAKGAALMENPMNAVLWLAADIKKSGGALKAGDLLSLGTFSRLHPAKPGGTARVRYEGLPGNPEVAARFVE